MRPLPSCEELNELLSYDPETGSFRWNANINMSGRNREPGTIRAGYLDICINGIHYGAHRLAWKLCNGRDPIGEIDHVNGIRTDNRIANLRDVSASENRRNAARPAHNTSGTVGVSYRPDKRRWRAHISIADRAVHLGYFDTWGDAVNARAAAEREYGFHPNHGRRA